MSSIAGDSIKQLGRSFRIAFIGPQLAAFIPALMLGAHWFGGEGFFLFTGIVLPGLLALTGFFSTDRRLSLPGTDPVTGLSPRPALITKLDRAHESGAPSACLILAIDDFDRLRRRLGHAGADRIARLAGEKLAGALREGDFLATLGAGRFAVAASGTQTAGLEAMIQFSARLQAKLADPLSTGTARLLITSCAGFALSQRMAAGSGAELFGAAEKAFERARLCGPGTVRAHSADMETAERARRFSGADLSRAIEQGEIRPWFQPQLSTDTGALTGFEALARWEHPRYGTLLPSEFLPLAEAEGLLPRLGEAMLSAALGALKAWDRSGIPVPSVAINLTPQELRDPKLADYIAWELDRHGIAPERLTAEILETVVAEDGENAVLRNTATLSRLGCAVVLDDFGTGHASIANIRRFGVNRIKIDRSFVTNVGNDRDQQNMVAAIVTMADLLGVATLAEGVETLADHAMLAQLGCGQVQGFAVSAPMPFEMAGNWAKAHGAQLEPLPSLPRKAG